MIYYKTEEDGSINGHEGHQILNRLSSEITRKAQLLKH